MIVREEPLGSGIFRCFSTHTEYGNSFTTPINNAIQNCRIVEMSRENGETYVMVERPTVGCLPEDVNIVATWDHRFVYAYGMSQTFAYHGGFRATIQFSPVYGAAGMPGPDCPLPDDTIVVEAKIIDNDQPWEIPDYRDVYMCREFRFPDDKRYHLVQLGVITYDISPATYHHVIIYDCPTGLPNREEWMEMKQCPGAGGTLGCFRFWTGWAAGQMPWCSATEAGQPVGAGEMTIVQGFLETHIDNPYSDSGIIDNGFGLRMWLTATLTAEDQLVFGHYLAFPPGGIPGRRSSFIMAGAWGGGCTEGMSDEGITITSVTPHLHGLGHQATVLLIPASNPNTTIVIYNQNNWDFNWQGPRMITMDHRVTMHRGDIMVSSCDFDSSNKTTSTHFGEGYEDEMCIFFISYLNAQLSYPLTMVGTNSAEQMGENGPYEDTRFWCAGNAPDFVDVVNIEGMAPAPAEGSQCTVSKQNN